MHRVMHESENIHTWNTGDQNVKEKKVSRY